MPPHAYPYYGYPQYHAPTYYSSHALQPAQAAYPAGVDTRAIPSTAYSMQPPGQSHSDPSLANKGAVAVKPPFLNFTHPGFIKGAVAGAAVAYLMSNENLQNAAIKASVKAWLALQGSMEEMKERFKDAEAEIVADETEA